MCILEVSVLAEKLLATDGDGSLGWGNALQGWEGLFGTHAPRGAPTTMHTQTPLCWNFNYTHLISPSRIAACPAPLVLIKNAKLDMQWLLFQLLFYFPYLKHEYGTI